MSRDCPDCGEEMDKEDKMDEEIKGMTEKN